MHAVRMLSIAAREIYRGAAAGAGDPIAKLVGLHAKRQILATGAATGYQIHALRSGPARKTRAMSVGDNQISRDGGARRIQAVVGI